MSTRPVVAAIGSREITRAEEELLFKTGAWIARRGWLLRSGGARGSDTIWARGAASVDPSCVTVCLPASDSRHLKRAPVGAQIEVPPYSDRLIELAVAEWEFGERLATVGLPPYDDPVLAKRFEERKGWLWLAQRKGNQNEGAPTSDTKPPEPNSAYVQQLMIRNAAILFWGDRPVDLVLGLLSYKKGGGGTGHAFRLARALGIPTFDLRSPSQLLEARGALERLQARSVVRPAGPGRSL